MAMDVACVELAGAPRNTILCGDALVTLRTLPDACVQCCVSSPPYFGLRDYQTASWVGGDPACAHLAAARGTTRGGQHSTLTGGQDATAHAAQARETCHLCGARRVDQQIGIETTLSEYVERLVEVFREVRRILRPDGVLWLNLGDSYANDGKWGGATGGKHVLALHGATGVGRARRHTGLKAKDLLGVPWAVAFALRDDGWYLRSEVIWHKPNSMPESVTDRLTRAHETLFLLAKSARYFYDADAIAEPSIEVAGTAGTWNGNRDFGLPGGQTRFGRPNLGGSIDGFRNRRDVWTIATEPYPGAHFAVMPTALVEPCVMAGSRPGDLVLDPFAGAGTVPLVAKRLGRDYLGIELNPEYVRIATERVEADRQPMLLYAPREPRRRKDTGGKPHMPGRSSRAYVDRDVARIEAAARREERHR